MNPFIMLLYLILLSSGVHSQVVLVNHSNIAVLVDGRFSGREWDDAGEFRLDASSSMFVKQDAGYLYIAFRCKVDSAFITGLDAYLSFNDTIINLHASAQLGERILDRAQNTYGEFNWWNNKAWAANTARIKGKLGEWHSDECKEFQLDKARFAAGTIKIMFFVSSPKKLVRGLPSDASSTNPDNWITLQL